MAKEYIDREAVYNKLLDFYRAVTSKYGEDDHYARGIAEGMDSIGEAPAADVAPVVHGRWVNYMHPSKSGYPAWECSKCRNVVGIGIVGRKYCPNCGAKMDGGDGK